MAHDDREKQVPWPVAVSFLIRPLDDEFTLPQVYAVAEPLRRAFPKNHHVEAKIRQSLQVLRERGMVQFRGAGRYRKVATVRASTVRLDFGVAARFVSGSQIARVAVESWAAANVSCWRCRSALLLVPTNAALLDAMCGASGHQVQIKAVNGVAGDVLTGAAYGPIARRLAEGPLPDYLVVSYDRPRAAVVIAEFIAGEAIVTKRVVPRSPLGPNAKRAGWIGSTIDVSGLERHVVVGPSLSPEIAVWTATARAT